MMHRVVIVLSLALLISAQKGKECNDDSGCDKNQTCSFGYCRCHKGFIKINRSCYKDQLRHGDICDFDVQCNDHRLTCLDVKEGDKRCQCCKHYEFDVDLEECIHAKNLTEMLSLLIEQWDNSGKIEKEAKTVFNGLVAAGLLSVVLGITFAGGCVIYGCCIPRWKMKQFMEPDYQTMPLCPVSREPTQTIPPEPPSPIGQSNQWDETSNATNASNISSTAEYIV